MIGRKRAAGAAARKERPSGRGTITFMIVPDDGSASRTYQVSYRMLRVLVGAAVTVTVAIVIMVGTWWFVASKAALVPGLESQVEALTAERERVMELVAQLEVIEERYQQLRDLFGYAGEDEASDVWLPPANTSRRATGAERAPTGASRPTSWPLTERGFVTQGLLAGTSSEDHPGLDIAVASDSYVRAAGGGTIVDVGEDPVYGRFVRVDHGDGYSSLYAHMSRTFVGEGQEVRRNEIIALSGSTGRSTAPHLHFEILRDGEAVDPLAMVRPPS